MTKAEWRELYAKAEEGDEVAQGRFTMALRELLDDKGPVLELIDALDVMIANDPELAKTFRKQARSHTKELLQNLLNISRTADRAEDRLSAANVLKGYGLDPETMEDPAAMTNEDAVQLMDAAVQSGPRS